MGGPPGGGGFDTPPEPGAERGRDRARSFGPDAIRKKGRKGGRDKGEKARGPKQPLQVTSTGRVFWDEDEDHNDELDVLGDGLDAETDDVDDDLDGDLDDAVDGGPDAEVSEGSAESQSSPDAEPDRDS